MRSELVPRTKARTEEKEEGEEEETRSPERSPEQKGCVTQAAGARVSAEGAGVARRLPETVGPVGIWGPWGRAVCWGGQARRVEVQEPRELLLGADPCRAPPRVQPRHLPHKVGRPLPALESEENSLLFESEIRTKGLALNALPGDSGSL